MIEHKSSRVDEPEVAHANAAAAMGTASERPMRARWTIATAIADQRWAELERERPGGGAAYIAACLIPSGWWRTAR